jgi:hypothetical protein
MEPTGYAVPGGAPLRARDGLAVLVEAAERGYEPLFVTEVAVNDATALAAALDKHGQRPTQAGCGPGD